MVKMRDKIQGEIDGQHRGMDSHEIRRIITAQHCPLATLSGVMHRIKICVEFCAPWHHDKVSHGVDKVSFVAKTRRRHRSTPEQLAAEIRDSSLSRSHVQFEMVLQAKAAALGLIILQKPEAAIAYIGDNYSHSGGVIGGRKGWVLTCSPSTRCICLFPVTAPSCPERIPNEIQQIPRENEKRGAPENSQFRLLSPCCVASHFPPRNPPSRVVGRKGRMLHAGARPSIPARLSRPLGGLQPSLSTPCYWPKYKPTLFEQIDSRVNWKPLAEVFAKGQRGTWSHGHRVKGRSSQNEIANCTEQTSRGTNGPRDSSEEQLRQKVSCLPNERLYSRSGTSKEKKREVRVWDASSLAIPFRPLCTQQSDFGRRRGRRAIKSLPVSK
ncbi:hypothetical protein CAPTEDRAFT_193532 [Capitella teleta]|uniref:Uncharacterized protein n=1 Tax=Capitella teleta TaxID=283909 RepID=R7UE42_CAPTE|nr:hypothetical protein CAPTEDRAFT_193532 [Capitella teleta]|eukprot:ELU04361.1 hypothetical protein CAPTEDRAFT_193532 [Capitella teleta]